MLDYTSCADCKRLIISNPYANAYGAERQYSIIDGRITCWECIEKLVKARGTVPYRVPKTELD